MKPRGGNVYDIRPLPPAWADPWVWLAAVVAAATWIAWGLGVPVGEQGR